MSDLQHEWEGETYRLFKTANMPLSPFGEAAESLCRLGYSVLPLRPCEKRPIHERWQTWCARQPTVHELFKWLLAYRGRSEEWNMRGYPNIGIACGSPVGPDHILLAVDIDLDDERLFAAVPWSPMIKASTNHGSTRFFRASPEIVSQSYDRLTEDGGRERLIDLLAGGRQTTVPGSIHPNGLPYHWLTGPVPASSLPVFDDDDLARLLDTIEAMSGFRTAARIERTSPGTFGTGGKWRDCNDMALANLASWVPHLPLFGLRQKRGGYEAVADWRQSSSGRPTTQRKRNLSIMPFGIVDFGVDEPYSPVDLVSRALGKSAGEALDWLKTRLGIEDDDGANLVFIDRKKERIGHAQ